MVGPQAAVSNDGCTLDPGPRVVTRVERRPEEKYKKKFLVCARKKLGCSVVDTGLLFRPHDDEFLYYMCALSDADSRTRSAERPSANDNKTAEDLVPRRRVRGCGIGEWRLWCGGEWDVRVLCFVYILR